MVGVRRELKVLDGRLVVTHSGVDEAHIREDLRRLADSLKGFPTGWPRVNILKIYRENVGATTHGEKLERLVKFLRVICSQCRSPNF